MKYPYIIKILSSDGSLTNLPFTAAKPIAEKAFYALSHALVYSDVTRLQLFLNNVTDHKLLVSIEHPFRG